MSSVKIYNYTTRSGTVLVLAKIINTLEEGHLYRKISEMDSISRFFIVESWFDVKRARYAESVWKKIHDQLDFSL